MHTQSELRKSYCSPSSLLPSLADIKTVTSLQVALEKPVLFPQVVVFLPSLDAFFQVPYPELGQNDVILGHLSRIHKQTGEVGTS